MKKKTSGNRKRRKRKQFDKPICKRCVDLKSTVVAAVAQRRGRWLCLPCLEVWS